jgi:hypothetical protein
MLNVSLNSNEAPTVSFTKITACAEVVNMGGSKRYMEDQDALRSQVIQIGLESDVLHYCEDDDEAYHDTGATEEAVELGLQKFKAGELEGFDNAQDVRKFIEDTINELPYECTRCEQRAGS